MSLLAGLLLAVVAGGARAQVPFAGSCPSQSVAKPFDVSLYLGQWYEQEKYFAVFQAGGKCVTAIYTDGGNGVVNVNNAQVGAIKGEGHTIVGTATLAVPGEGKLTVRFPSVGNNPAPYWVLDTDYSSYSIVWSCTNILGLLNTQHLWILTREKNPSPEFVERLEKIVKHRGLNTHALRKTLQDCY